MKSEKKSSKKRTNNGPSDLQQSFRTARNFQRRQIKRDRKAVFWKTLLLPKIKNAARKARRALKRRKAVPVPPAP